LEPFSAGGSIHLAFLLIHDKIEMKREQDTQNYGYHMEDYKNKKGIKMFVVF